MRVWWLPVILLLAAAGLQISPSLPNFSPANAKPGSRIRCTKTLGSGANLSRAISVAAGGTTLCLRSGAYDAIEATGVKNAHPVTVRSTPGARATLKGIDLIDPAGLRFVALDLTGGVSISPSAADIQFIDNDITGPSGIYMFGDYRIGKQIDRVLIEGNNIHDIDYSGEQETGYGYGIEGVGDVRHVLIRDNTIQSTASDYLQSATPVHWVVDHNTFLGPSLLGNHEDHQDLWQIFGGGRDIAFTNNVARHTGTQESLLFQEGAFRKVVVENNLFDHDSRGYTCQIYQSDGLRFSHNTIVGSRWGCLFRDQAGSPPGSGYRIVNNVFADTRDGGDVSTEGRAAGWGTYDYNVSSDSSAAGAHSLRRWSPRWSSATTYAPLGLPFAAGYVAR
ncbi:MAG TPA: right-handed parallel beta-helix repeat-containing protein [Solirubrobacterales bacterium]